MRHDQDMQSDNKIRTINSKLHTGNVHFLLAHSHFFYFLAFLAGLLLDFLFPVRIFTQSSILVTIGTVVLILATLLILWAESTARNFKKENMNKESFCHGPYCFTRTPTEWGLLFLIIGFGLIANTFFIILFTIVSFIVSKIFFVKKQEMVLAEKYGDSYLEYKKSVRF